MRQNGLRARQKRRFKRTTDRHHAWPVAPNLLEQDFTARGPDTKWGADISCVWTREGWLYLAVVIDLFARRVVGWATADRLHRNLMSDNQRSLILSRFTERIDLSRLYLSRLYKGQSSVANPPGWARTQ